MSGLGWTEFLNVAKAVFVEVATEDYGLRGRPTNISRVAAMTGLSRKEISKIRSESITTRWTPSMEKSPANMVIHHWHHDPDFCMSPGVPRTLPFEGANSFVALVRKYAGDIPPGAMRTVLCRTKTVSELPDKSLRAETRFIWPSDVYDDYIRNIAFAWSNFGNTVVHNTCLLSQEETGSVDLSLGRFERSAWTESITPEAAEAFQKWVRTEGARFVEGADHWIGQHETPIDDWAKSSKKTIGVGVYFFQED
jgi:hypothetical protein